MTPNAESHAVALAELLRDMSHSFGILVTQRERLDMQNRAAVVLASFYHDFPEHNPYTP
jgi:hypothetical protein